MPGWIFLEKWLWLSFKSLPKVTQLIRGKARILNQNNPSANTHKALYNTDSCWLAMSVQNPGLSLGFWEKTELIPNPRTPHPDVRLRCMARLLVLPTSTPGWTQLCTLSSESQTHINSRCYKLCSLHSLIHSFIDSFINPWYYSFI